MKFKLRSKGAPFVSTSGANTYVSLPPAKLVKIFGDPQSSDEYKVSGEYSFSTPNGGVITLYDWKATKLYDSGNEFSPEELWSSEAGFEFKIGGDNLGQQQVREFVAWIQSALTNSVRFIKED